MGQNVFSPSTIKIPGRAKGGTMERGKRSMEGTYKYSYKVGENLMNSLSVCNVGHQRCETGYKWGPGVRNHYCIHYVISGKGYYEVNGVVRPLASGDLFILYPDAQIGCRILPDMGRTTPGWRWIWTS